jgi:glycosyltransferase involved in cell wall biosynthesis
MGAGFARPVDDPPRADVSVVIPVYNHERFVGAAIDSVLSQTVRVREIICIDDGSTDSSAQVLEAITAQHPDVRFWSRSNQGANRTINDGIREARGRFVAILNSDDLYHPERLRRCLAVLDEHPDVTAVATGISFVDEHGNTIRYPWYEETHAFYEQIGDLGLALVNGNFLMTTSNIVARLTVFDEMGGFDDLRYAHDLDFFLRLVAYGKRLVVLPEPLLTYRVHGSNTIFDAPLEMRLETALVIAFFAQRIVAAGGVTGHEPQYLSRILEITERHELTRLVALSLLHAREGTEVRSPAACLVDAAFSSDASREMGAADVAAPDTVGDAAVSPMSDAEAHHGAPAIPPIWRRLLDRFLRAPLARRFFASVRWRSGLDADLHELGERLDRVEAALDASPVHAETGARVETEARRIAQALDQELATLDAARRESVARKDTVDSRLAAVQSSLGTVASRVAATESHRTDADGGGARTGEQPDEFAAIMRRRLGRPGNATR